MKRLHSFILGIATVSLVTASAQAQVCPDNLEDTLRSCVETSVNSCTSAAPTCTKEASVLTIEDARREVIAACCPTRLNTRRRAVCFTTQKRKFTLRGVTRKTSRFARSVRYEIDAIRKSNCFNNAYSNLF